MQSNYKPIGDYIQKLKVRNSENRYSELLGINIDKFFMPSVANVVGTNLSRYLIVEPGQFACNRMHVGRDYRIPVALSEKEKPFIVSPAYDVFEIKDPSLLLPEYLMMWFRRAEFDRNAWFYTDADVRGGLAWDAFCSIELPVPSIEKQREIVREYNVVKNRIKLNEEINQKLEETAQALYKHWFVDFEFPNKEGKPYKSSGGKMVYNDELDKEIPEGWEVKSLNELTWGNPENFTISTENFTEIEYLEISNITKNKIDNLKIIDVLEDKIPSRAKRKVKHNDIIYSTVRPALCHYGILRNPSENLIVSTGFSVLRVKDKNLTEIIYQFITSEEITNTLQAKAEMSVSTYPSIKLEDVGELKIALPTENLVGGFRNFNKRINHNNLESRKLTELQEVLLSKMSTVEETVVVLKSPTVETTILKI